MSAALRKEPDTIGEATRRRLAGFTRTLRDNGFRVGLAETRDALTLLASPAGTQPHTLLPAMRALFCATHSDWERFDELFNAYWRWEGRRSARVLSGTPSTQPAPLKRIGEPSGQKGPHGMPDHVQRGSDEDETHAQGQGKREGASHTENLGQHRPASHR